MNQHSLSRRALLKATAFAGAALILHAPARLLAAPADDAHSQSKIMLGTFVRISAVHAERSRAEDALAAAFAEMSRLEAILTRHTASSPLAVLAAQGRLNDVPVELTTLLAEAKRVHSRTGGAFDVTVAPLLDAYRAHQNPQGRMHIDPKDIAQAAALVDASQLYLDRNQVTLGRAGMALTLDGVAKGYIADQASRVLCAHNVTNHLINAGGDIRASGNRGPGQPWRVAVEHPGKKGIAASLSLNAGLATSGSYELYFDASREHHHILDPALKKSPRHSLSVSVTAPTAVEADALATALSVMPLGDGLRLVRELPAVECCILLADGRAVLSDGWA